MAIYDENLMLFNYTEDKNPPKFFNPYDGWFIRHRSSYGMTVNPH